jgi:thioredoxin reductase
MFDAVIVGGSYAGLSAAMQLARARRRLLVIDGGQRRNRFAQHSHGFLSRDGAAAADIAGEARRQLLGYPTVEWRDATVVSAMGSADAFVVTDSTGRQDGARRILLALGVTDELPGIPGLAERWGRSVFHCPYCHGYEIDGPIGVLNVLDNSIHQALMLPDWGPTTFLLNGKDASADDLDKLAARGVALEPAPVEAIVNSADVRLADGREVRFGGLFSASRTRPSTDLAVRLGCMMEDGPAGSFIATDMVKQTSIPGVFACGDAARPSGNVALAVGDGAMAGAGIHRSLMFGL